MHLVIIKKMTSNITTPATCAQPPRNQDEGVYIAHGGKYKQDGNCCCLETKVWARLAHIDPIDEYWIGVKYGTLRLSYHLAYQAA